MLKNDVFSFYLVLRMTVFYMGLIVILSRLR